jgi:hypothetical protein
MAWPRAYGMAADESTRDTMARTWKAVAVMMGWAAAALPASAQFSTGLMPPPPTPIGYSGVQMMAPVMPTSQVGQPMPPWQPPMPMPAGPGARPGAGPQQPGMPPGPHGPHGHGMPPGGPGHPGHEPALPDIDSKYIRENAFEGEHPDWIPFKHQLNFEYLIMYFKAFGLPPLATAGDITDDIPGALGQPGTRIIFGDSRVSAGPSSAFRVTWTSWIIDPEQLGVDASFMIMEQRTVGNTARSDDFGEPVLGRPYFDPVAEVPNADPRSVTATKVGVLRDFVQTRFMQAEGHVKYNATGMPSCTGPVCTLFAGPRWIKLDEKYFSDDFTQDIPVGTGQTFLHIQDNFTTYNEFLGGQVGIAYRHRWDRFLIDVITKFAVGNNFQTARISGFTSVLDDTTGEKTRAPQGLYAQPTNVGTYKQDQISIVPEFGVNIGFFLTENFKFSVGYGIFWMNNVIRPGSMIDTTVNVQPLNPTTPSQPFRPSRPELDSTDFWAQWVNFSWEFVF